MKEFKEKLEEKDCLLMHKNDLVGKLQSENSAKDDIINSMKVSLAEKYSLSFDAKEKHILEMEKIKSFYHINKEKFIEEK